MMKVIDADKLIDVLYQHGFLPHMDKLRELIDEQEQVSAPRGRCGVCEFNIPPFGCLIKEYGNFGDDDYCSNYQDRSVSYYGMKCKNCALNPKKYNTRKCPLRSSGMRNDDSFCTFWEKDEKV